MSHAHELVRKALRGGHPGGVDWHRLMAAMREVAAGAAAGTGEDAAAAGRLAGESVEVLHSVLEFRGRLAIAEGSELPHAMPPEEMLRVHAVQALARADLDRHRAVIQRVADAPESSERLAEVARWVLRGAGGG